MARRTRTDKRRRRLGKRFIGAGDHRACWVAYHRARLTPSGKRLDQQVADALRPVASALAEGGDPQYLADFDLILTNMIYVAIGRFADGKPTSRKSCRFSSASCSG